MAKIELKNIHKSFGQKKVLQGVDLLAGEGESLVIIGASGTGKSVLIKLMVGLIEKDSGEVLVDDKPQNITNFGFLFQHSALFDSLNIMDNVTFQMHKENLKYEQRREIAAAKLKMVGLNADILHMYPDELSGGMQKRVALARAICTNPKIIFFDEPTTGLDPIMANVINDLIVKIKNELSATIVTITHDMHSAKVIADNVAMLHGGKIIWHGKSKAIEKSGNPYVEQFISGKIDGPIAEN